VLFALESHVTALLMFSSNFITITSFRGYRILALIVLQSRQGDPLVFLPAPMHTIQ
jgi:hypothetical protein